jgi:ubiquinone/menaquinone biosynthesis C-methylase UbiE
MKMTRLEKLLVNTPFRALHQRLVATNFFLRHSQLPNRSFCLEIGCGQGAGVKLILEKFNARQVTALDYDIEQLRLAQRRIRSGEHHNVHLLVSDAASLCFTKAQFDAVFDYGILHHVPDWTKALSEIYRVLKPKGFFFYEEILKPVLTNYLFAKLFPHPPEGYFTRLEFEHILTQAGFTVIRRRQFAVSYLLGVARKP